jgi:hypothetical protein
MKLLKFGLPYLVILIISSCGGVVGNIKYYNFPLIHIDSLRKAVSNVVIKNPELSKIDTSRFKNTVHESYCSINDGKDIFIMHYKLLDAVIPYDSVVDIILVSAAGDREIMYFASDLSYFKKKRYGKLFEINFIDKVRAELILMNKKKYPPRRRFR